MDFSADLTAETYVVEGVFQGGVWHWIGKVGGHGLGGVKVYCSGREENGGQMKIRSD